LYKITTLTKETQIESPARWDGRLCQWRDWQWWM